MNNFKYAGINFNDFSAAPGVSLTFFAQGCPHRCHNCQNPDTWDFDSGIKFDDNVLNDILKGLTANGIQRNLCIMGGEPLCPENLQLVSDIIESVHSHLPDIKIYIWTGYLYEQLQINLDTTLKKILTIADYLIDGPYIDSQRDITLKMRGSRNQRIINLKTLTIEE